MRWISKLIDSVSERGREIWQSENPGTLVHARSLGDDCMALMRRKGDAVAMAIARQILDRYQSLDASQKLEFFRFLQSLRPDYALLSKVSAQLAEEESAENYQTLLSSFHQGRRTLFELLNAPGEGTSALVAMRKDLLGFLRAHPDLKPVDLDLQHTLESWFNRGFLEFRAITWHTPADVLEKLIRYEAVHEISDWQDLKRRLADDRECFAFFHPALPDEPLIFVQVAYTREISASIEPFLDQTLPVTDQDSAQAAIFYSISNCQGGLKGISFGNFLIKQVVQHIRSRRPNIRYFSTLSPMPALNKAVEKGAISEDQLVKLAGSSAPALSALSSDGSLSTLLLRESDRLEPESSETVRWLESVGLHYLTGVRKGSDPYDPVARFHLSNGASIFRINPFANTKGYGLKSSAGLMVNYLYDLDRVELNHEQFKQHGTIDVHKQLKKLSQNLRDVA